MGEVLDDFVEIRFRQVCIVVVLQPNLKIDVSFHIENRSSYER